MLRIITLLMILCFTVGKVSAQMWNGTDTLYGNEWIDYDQSYFKIKVAQDGLYRLSKGALESAGFPVNNINGARLQLFYMGKEVPLYVTSDQLFNADDYLEFYGQKNKSQLDQYLYANPETDMLNPEYSLVSDTSAYFLTWTDTGTNVARFDNVANNLNNLPTADAYYWEEELVNFFETNVREVNGDNVAKSTFDRGEGFGSEFRTSHSIEINSNEVNASGGAAVVSVRLTTNIGSHDIAVALNGEGNINDTPNGFSLQEYSFEVAADNLNDNNTLSVQSSASAFDKTSVSNVRLTYPRNFNFNGENKFIFKVRADNSDRYLEIENFNAEGQEPVLYDVTNQLRIPATLDNGLVKIKLPASSADRTLILSSQGTGYNNSQATETDFTDYSVSNAQFIIISHPKLYDDGSGVNYVNEYANYRGSAEGGNFNIKIVNIEELYDQFGYGIDRHFISIRNFGHYIKRAWTNPQYIFIIGKGRVFYNIRNELQINGAQQDFAVPTFGAPGADNLLATNPGSTIPIIPIGRIAVSSPEDIKNYLDKIKIMENSDGTQTIDDQLWKKQILHLGGGGSNEQTVIKNHLIGMENIIVDSKFGGDVTGVYKTSSDPIQIGESDAIFDRINDGVSLLTFFGHSAVGTFDFNIDNPDRYENYGKYPVLFSLGCYSGNIHTSAQGVSERFIFLKDKGAVAFAASTGQGYVSPLAALAKEYYRLLSEDMYGESIGNVMQQTLKNFENNQSFSYVTLKQQFTIHGDPAFRVNPSPGPDYVVGINSVSFEPMNITAAMDSFTIKFAVTNLGSGAGDSMNIKIKQALPDGDVLTLLTDRIETPKFENNLSYKVASFKKLAAGQNMLFIDIDTDNEVEELPSPSAEFNNQLIGANNIPGLPFYIFDDSAIPVYPKEFGIVNQADITLKASTSNAFIPERKYIMEIDVTEEFNSPIKKRTEIIQGGGVVKWAPEMALQENTVYYWRISPDSLGPEAPFVWENSSFVYLPNSSNGWNQSHFFQYKKDEFEGLNLDEQTGFDYDVNGYFITIKNKVYDPTERPFFSRNFDNPAASVNPWGFFNQGVAVAVTDSVTGKGWKNPAGGTYGSYNPSFSRVFCFATNTQEERELLMTFLDDVIGSRNFVFVWTILRNETNDFSPELWAQDSVALGRNIYNILEEQGATLVRQLETKGSVPYSFIFRKDEGLIVEGIADDINSETIVDGFIPINLVDGNIQSVVIGPSREWQSLQWQLDDVDDTIIDTTYLTIYGIDANQNESPIVEKITATDTSLSFIDAAQYPYIRLEYYSKDEVNRTAPDMRYWRVLYEGLPDAAINANELFTFNSDTLQQGELMELALAIENISDYNMDSLLVKLSVMDEANNEILQLERYQPLGVNEVINTSFSIDTRAIDNIQQMVMEVNPNNDQAELYRFNNFALKQFFVEKDKRNPLMDVTFDGVHILDGDIVSPKPEIYISLKDENKFLSLSDTSLFKLFLKYPGQQIADNIPIGHDWVDFFPDSGNGGQNKAMIRLNPTFETEGIYELLVQAEDVTGNQSGDLDYKVTFEVITKSSISNVLNYPNPFSTSTQFVYTLTGEEIPDYFKIQILTVNGKIVKEITQDEIGPLRVGTHRTDYRWDGTDEYGDRLANGVYLYRIVAKKQGGEGYEAFDNGTNAMFNQGFGKLVIIR